MVRRSCSVRLGGAWCYLFIPLGMGGVEGLLGWLRVGWIGAVIGEFYLVQLGCFDWWHLGGLRADQGVGWFG